MALIIPPNSSSLSLDPQLGVNQAAKSTGKANVPGVDTAAEPALAKNGEGLAISDALRIQLRSLASTERNANDVISMAQTADGALGQMGGLLERMRNLAVEDAGGQLTDQGRQEARLQISQLQTQMDGIQKSAVYDGRPLLGAEAVEVGVDVALAGGASDRLAVTLGGLGPLALGNGAQAASAPSRASDSMVGRIDDALAAIANQRVRFGAAVNRFADAATAVQAARARRAAGSAPVENADAATELANLVKTQIIGQGPAALLTQANQLPAHAMSLLQD